MNESHVSGTEQCQEPIAGPDVARLDLVGARVDVSEDVAQLASLVDEIPSCGIRAADRREVRSHQPTVAIVLVVDYASVRVRGLAQPILRVPAQSETVGA